MSYHQHNLEVTQSSGHELLDYVLLALDDNPERVDLWMMRFEIIRNLGLKDSMAQAMQTAYAGQPLRRQIDWRTVSKLWSELAPGEPPPEGVCLPATSTSALYPFKERRFADLASNQQGSLLQALADEYDELRQQPGFFKDFARATRDYLGRPTPLHRAKMLEQALGFDGRILLKREDHQKVSPEREYALAQAYIASALGRETIICGNEVDGFAFELARVAPRFGLALTVTLPPEDMRNVALVNELARRGCRIVSAEDLLGEGADSRQAALQLWARSSSTSHLALGFGSGPNPYPRMVQDFQMLLGQETALQLRADPHSKRQHILLAATQSEADAIGFMLPMLRRTDLELFLVEARANSSAQPPLAMRWANYQGARREHNWLRATGAITYIPIHDDEASDAQQRLADTEGITISPEDGRALALACALVDGGIVDRDLVVLVA